LLPDEPDDRSLVPPCDECPGSLELPLRLEPLIPPLERSDPRSIDGLRVAELPMPSSFWLPRSVRLPRSFDEAFRPLSDDFDASERDDPAAP